MKALEEFKQFVEALPKPSPVLKNPLAVEVRKIAGRIVQIEKGKHGFASWFLTPAGKRTAPISIPDKTKTMDDAFKAAERVIKQLEKRQTEANDLEEAAALVNRNARHFGSVAVGWERFDPDGTDPLGAFELVGVKQKPSPFLAFEEDKGAWVLYPTGKGKGDVLFKDSSGKKHSDALNIASAEIIEMFFQGKL